MKIILALSLLFLTSCQFQEFLLSPTGKALTQAVTTKIVSEAVESNPDLEQTLSDLADNLEAEGSDLSPDSIRKGLAQAQPKSNK